VWLKLISSCVRSHFFSFLEGTILIGPSPNYLEHWALLNRTISLNPKFQNRNKCTPLWFTFSVYIHGICAKPYRIKLVLLGVSGGYLWKPDENSMGTWWEHIRTKKKTHPPASPPRIHTQEKDWTPHGSMLSLLIGCMKLLFPKLFVTIFGLGECQGHKLWDYGWCQFSW